MSAGRTGFGRRLTLPQQYDAGPRSRPCPLPPLVPTWTEHFSFLFETAAGATETQLSRVIHGPYVIRHISYAHNDISPVDSRFFLQVQNSDATTTDETQLGATITSQGVNDDSVQSAALPLPFTPADVPVGYVNRDHTTRLRVTCRNSDAGAFNTTVVVVLAHLAPADEEPHPLAY